MADAVVGSWLTWDSSEKFARAKRDSAIQAATTLVPCTDPTVRRGGALLVLVAVFFAVVAGSYGAAAEPAIVDLGTLGGNSSRPTAVNASGQVVGRSSIAGGPFHAFSWTRSKGMVDLGTLGGSDSRPTEVNARGQVIGSSSTAKDEFHAFSWTESGGMVDLGTLGGSNSHPIAMNARGQVIGTSYIAGDAEAHAFSWSQSGGDGRPRHSWGRLQ